MLPAQVPESAPSNVEMTFSCSRVTDDHHMHRGIEHRVHAATFNSGEKVVSHTKLSRAENTLLVPLVQLDGEGVVTCNRS